MVNTRTCSSPSSTPKELASTSEKTTSGKKMKQTRLSFASKAAHVASPEVVRKRKLSSPETEQDRTVKIVRREGDPDPDPEPIEVIDDDEDNGDARPEADTDMVEILRCDDSNSVTLPATETPPMAADNENTNGSPLNESVTVDGNSSSGSEDPDKTVPESSLAHSLEPPTNTAGKPLTPRQLEKFLEKKQRHEERLRQKLEREKKLEDERRQREDRERQKKKEREEREELKRKEREEKEATRVREKEEKESAKQREKEEKETARLKEKEDRERKRQLELDQKSEEKRRREEQKEEERRKKEEEKRNKEIEEEQKRKKAAQAFTKFFKVGAKTEEDKSAADVTAGNGGLQQSSADIVAVDAVNRYFMPFQVKGDMKLAPTVRRVLNGDAKSALDKVLLEKTQPETVPVLYLKSLNTKSHVPLKGAKTLISSEASDGDSDDDLMVVDDELAHKVEEIKTKERYRAKCLMFHENRRPAYYGTWQKKSNVVGPRKPFAKDEKHFDYEVESDDEWEEEEPGESLHGSEDEKDKESEDDYEVDNDFFVPHGHLSDEEMQNADEPEDNSPEAQKVKLKLLQDEFNDEMKKKTEKIKPRLIGCIWANEAGGKPDNCPAVFWELLQFRAVLSAGPIQLRPAEPEGSAGVDEDADAEDNTGDKKKRHSLTEEEVRHLIRLVHGNLNSCKFVVKEFQVYREKAETSAAVSNLSILRKIKEIAKWETPPSFSCCWVVRKEILDQYDLSELPLVNKWEYALTPKRTHENLKSAAAEKKQQLQQPNQTPGSPLIMTGTAVVPAQVNAPKTPVVVAQEKVSPPSAKQKSTQNSIARFTKVLTEEEKQRQFNSTHISSPKQSTTTTNTPNENTAPFGVAKQKVNAIVKSETVKVSPGVTPSSSSSIAPIEVAAATKKNGALAKKRVPLLMSVPRGQAISEQSKNLLIRNFLQKQPREKAEDLNKLPESTAADPGKQESVVIATIVLD